MRGYVPQARRAPRPYYRPVDHIPGAWQSGRRERVKQKCGDRRRSAQIENAMTESKPSTIKEGGPELYPVLPLRDIVVFPYMIVPLFVGREKSIAALEEVMRSDRQILLVAQKNASDDEP